MGLSKLIELIRTEKVKNKWFKSVTREAFNETGFTDVRLPIRQHMYTFALQLEIYTVKPQWLESLWDHENLFEIWVVRAIEG